MIKNTKENRGKLSAAVVNDMDLDTLIEFAEEQHESFYDGFSDEDFYREWKELFGEE